MRNLVAVVFCEERSAQHSFADQLLRTERHPRPGTSVMPRSFADEQGVGPKRPHLLQVGLQVVALKIGPSGGVEVVHVGGDFGVLDPSDAGDDFPIDRVLFHTFIITP